MTNKEKIAVPLDFAPSIVALSNGDRMSRKEAKEKGWKIYGEPDATAPDNETAAKHAAHMSWHRAVLALPEARQRESAATEIVNTHTEHTMSVVNARAFLRGLPTEQTQEETTTMTTDNANPERAARLAEINGGMQAFNKQRGFGARTNATPMRAGDSLAGVDQTKLRRLSQIRLNALESGTAHETSAGEAKKLRYALSVEGMALSDVFAQLAVDTSKLRI